ncbi:TonB-dependent siderophore receptor [Solimonas marina]|uniref:TonB-dependent siderophore receptor n=1 Tax=Solimonas marina TaxID=2714601 RepID=A0A969WBZ2_9GAMM|nr:TonB-dependent siderophore receptor [Solimonas marina]NKF23389.1 TonB-dependent siderophore receptor [Solimonas marina]
MKLSGFRLPHRFALAALAGVTVVPIVAHAADTADAAADTTTDTTAAPGDADIATILITTKRAERTSTGATGLDLDIKDTPQSISTVTQEQMDRFGTSSINDALRLATGVSVENWETNRTNYLSRGFEIKNSQIDGVGLPNDWGIVTGAVDTYGYDKIEVIRGANGLLTGVGNASGTINYVRKRPTNTEQGEAEVKFGSWGNRRVEADYSTPFTKDGSWAGRIVVAREDNSDGYLRDFNSDRTYVYGVVDGQLSERSTLTLGWSVLQDRSTGNMWGALTFSNSDGTQSSFDASSSTTQKWTYWNTGNQNPFIEYTYQLAPDWQFKASYNYRRSTDHDQLFYAYSANGLDPDTREGLYGWAYKGAALLKSQLGDMTISGHFSLFGREHQAILGTSLAASEQRNWYYPVDYSDPAFGALPAFPYALDAIAEPDWGEKTLDTSINQKLTRVYGVTRLALTDRLKAIVGFNYARYHRDGDNAGAFDQTESKTSPYGGLTFDLTQHVLAYASYSDIYQPQDQYDINHVYLDPSKGINYEVGIKADWLDRRVLTTLAWFTAKQDNLATYAGIGTDGNYYYSGMDVKSRGVEFEATGKLGSYVDVVFGYTKLKLTDDDGDSTYKWVPRDTVKLQLVGRLPTYTALSAGIGGRWRSKTSNTDGTTDLAGDANVVRQDRYAVLNAFASWDVRPNVTVRANVNNLTDEKYITSLYTIGYYGAPRNYAVNLSWRF